MKKTAIDMRVDRRTLLNDDYALLWLTPCGDGHLPDGIMPGQFVQIDIPGSKTTYLRRPISVNLVDYANDRLWLLVRKAGKGTERLINSRIDDVYNIILPLGHGFTETQDGDALLVGGGVGVAPLLYLGKRLHERGVNVRFALGARSAGDILELDEFSKYGTVHISTEDGSMGEKGLITTNSVFDTPISHIACCGPTPMMRAVASIASARGIDCEVSLENMMACGLGACLCCVEDTVQGNVCVCTNGPVFNIKELKW